mmetsp:Transcript_14003/g.33091  ORF Transcript_14003/g.33091 Transcript_14003/m.33091 type:complete len:247 (+) Transcript_14003:951-1691(+)
MTGVSFPPDGAPCSACRMLDLLLHCLLLSLLSTLVLEFLEAMSYSAACFDCMSRLMIWLPLLLEFRSCSSSMLSISTISSMWNPSLARSELSSSFPPAGRSPYSSSQNLTCRRLSSSFASVPVAVTACSAVKDTFSCASRSSRICLASSSSASSSCSRDLHESAASDVAPSEDSSSRLMASFSTRRLRMVTSASRWNCSSSLRRSLVNSKSSDDWMWISSRCLRFSSIRKSLDFLSCADSKPARPT